MEVIVPKNENEWLDLRTKDITSTDVAALFGLSPYCTPFELWHRKKTGSTIGFEETEWIKWGKRLQDSIAEGVAEDNGWKVRRMDEYIRIPELRMGSSFDFSIDKFVEDQENGPLTLNADSEKFPGKLKRGFYAGDGILEIKNVFGMQFRSEWMENDDGSLEAPAHIEMQVQHQLAVSGRAFSYIAALVDGNKLVLIKRTPNKEIIDMIKTKVAGFWKSIDDNSPPQPNYATDAEFISRLYNYAEPGKVFDARNDVNFSQLAAEHKELGEQVKLLTERRDAIKSQILTVIGDAEKVIADGFSISASTVGPAHIEYERAPYRLFKINWPRAKKG